MTQKNHLQLGTMHNDQVLQLRCHGSKAFLRSKKISQENFLLSRACRMVSYINKGLSAWLASFMIIKTYKLNLLSS